MEPAARLAELEIARASIVPSFQPKRSMAEIAIMLSTFMHADGVVRACLDGSLGASGLTRLRWPSPRRRQFAPVRVAQLPKVARASLPVPSFDHPFTLDRIAQWLFDHVPKLFAILLGTCLLH